MLMNKMHNIKWHQLKLFLLLLWREDIKIIMKGKKKSWRDDLIKLKFS